MAIDISITKSRTDIANIENIYIFAPLKTKMVQALVAKLVDALVSGTSNRKIVQVRVLSWAHETLKLLYSLRVF